MFKRVTVLFVVGLLALSVGAVGGVNAQTSDWSLDKSSETVTFEPGDGSTITDTVTITNNDENNSVSISASIGGSHTVVSQPNTVGPGESADIEVELSANDPGPATLRVEDNNNNIEEVDYTVETPAYVEISGVPDWVDDEGVLRGDSRTAQITVEEVGGNQGFSGMDVTGDTDGISGLSGVSVGAGGSEEVTVTFTADSGADQHEDIGGTLDLDPDDGYNVESSVNLESYVAYPAYFGEAGLSIDTIEFDEPRSVGSISRTATLGIENAGDRELDFGQVSTGSMPFELTVQDQPNTIAPRSTARLDVEIVAGTGLSEGAQDFQVTFQSNDAGVDSSQFTDTIQIEHGIEMAVDPTQVRTGDIPIGDAESSSITVSEGLGYRDINNAEMSLSEGPESYVEVTDGVDSTIAAGGSSNVGYEIQFDPDADIGTEYTWTFEIEGDNVETEEVTITATPIPLNLDPLRQSLEEAPGGSQALDQTSEETLQLVDNMDEQIRAGEVPQQDITTVLTFGDGVVRYLEALAATDELIADGEYDAAQEELVRAAVAYDTMTTYGEAIEDDDLRDQAISVRETAGGELQERIETQEAHYEEQLAAEDTAPIEEAAIKRQLSRIAALQGDTERSQTLESEADAAFDEYSTLVAEGETQRQEAVGIWNGMESDMFVSVLGQQLIVNPIHYDEFEQRSETLLSRYDDAEAAFTEAGETTRAEAVAQERTQRANALTIARWSLLASIGISALLIVLLIIHTARGMYWYVQDSRESISGDFLVG